MRLTTGICTLEREKELYESGALFPRLARLRHISSLIAVQIIEAAQRDNLCTSGSLPVFHPCIAH
jgi:hypothetical protein